MGLSSVASPAWWVGFGLLVLARLAAQLWLDGLNRGFVVAHAAAVPEAFRAFVDPETYRKALNVAGHRHDLIAIDLRDPLEKEIARLQDEVNRIFSAALTLPRSRTFARWTAIGPTPVWIARAGP